MILIVNPSLDDVSPQSRQRQRADAVAFSPRAHAANVCHSGSFCELQCFPPLWKKSPPASSASGCTRSLLFMSPGVTRGDTTSKFLRDCSSFHVVAPGERGCKRIGVPEAWHETHRA